MKVRGISRKLDTLGRVVIPKEIRDELGMEERQYVEMVMVEEGILIRVNNSTIEKDLKDYSDKELLEELHRRKSNE